MDFGRPLVVRPMVCGRSLHAHDLLLNDGEIRRRHFRPNTIMTLLPRLERRNPPLDPSSDLNCAFLGRTGQLVVEF